jgi:hypothetical protein
MRKHSLKPLPKLKRKAESLFHKWIVKRDKGICFICGRIGNQAGHFRHGKLDFDEMNLNCSCAYCNLFLHGNLGMYAIKLIEKYGKDSVDELVLRSNTQTNKFSRSELEELIEKYSEKTKVKKNGRKS